MQLLNSASAIMRRSLKSIDGVHNYYLQNRNADSKVERKRDISPLRTPRNSYSSLRNFEQAPTLSSGIYEIWENGLPIDISLKILKGAPLVVVFHGAANPDVRLPWLSGHGVLSSLPVSHLSISDPSLYLNPALNLAWFAGSSIQSNLPDLLTRIISKVKASTIASQLILLGGSGGGFASLRLAPEFSECTAVVMNPQTVVEKYHRPHVDRYIKLAWEGNKKLFRDTTEGSAINAIKSSNNSPTVFYLQNSRDSFHAKAHLAPFLEEFSGTNNFYLLQKAWNDGHTPPPKELITDVMRKVIIQRSDLLISKFGFALV